MSHAPTDEYEPPRLTQAVLWLIALNVAIHFLQITVQADLPRWLGFSQGEFGAQPWTLGTYMFVHAGFWHLALNMYMLWAFGPRLERSWTTAAFTRFYLWCGAGGVVGQLLMPGDALLVGASAAVFGVLYAYARRWPDDEVLFFGVVPMKVRWLVLFMAVTNFALGALAAGEEARGGTAYLAHLGGLAFGWLWFRRPNAPTVERLRARVATTPEPPEGLPRAVPKSLPRPPREQRGSEADEVVERSKALTAKQPQPARPVLPVPPPPPPPRPAAPVAAVAAPASRTAALDLVLEKISARGLGSLTVEERRLLDETSERLRTQG
jgi:membrane associated rhomboid family serine protease